MGERPVHLPPSAPLNSRTPASPCAARHDDRRPHGGGRKAEGGANLREVRCFEAHTVEVIE